MLSTYMFSPDAALPQVFYIIQRSKNHTGPQLQTPVLILDITLLDDDMFWYCIFCIAVNTV